MFQILAKLVCGMHKPNRQTVLPFSSVAELYRTLPVKKVRNLGGKLGDDVVETLGITHMAELTNFTEKQLQAKYDDKTGYVMSICFNKIFLQYKIFGKFKTRDQREASTE